MTGPLGEKAAPDTRAGKAGFAEQYYTPRPGSVPDPRLHDLAEACAKSDASLHAVAEWTAARHAELGQPPLLDEVSFQLRKAGSSYVMPRLWAAEVQGQAGTELADNLSEWAHARPARGELRCGVGSYEKDGLTLYSAVLVDVIADTKPFPSQVKTGERKTLELDLLIPATAAEVVLLPPQGRPRNLSTELKLGHLTANFALETPGTWYVQVMATVEGGPAPVAGLLLGAGQAQKAEYSAELVPGEDAYNAQLSREDALLAMINAARKQENLPALKRSPRGDSIARAHSEQMRKRSQIAHDTGQGDPAVRVARAGLTPKATGENVAMAGSVPRLHHVLWNSPSHRENLLQRRWDEVGLGFAADESGQLYLTELFLDFE